MNNLKLFNATQLNDVEKRILQYIVDNINIITKIGVRGIAKNTYTSTSVVMRLSKKLGYTGFLDMYYKIYPLIKKQYTFDHEITSTAKDHFFSYDSIFTYNDITQFHYVAKEIAKSNKFIFFYGTGFSSIIAEYFYKKLLILGKKCMMASGTDSSGVLENNIRNIKFFFVISKSGQTELVVNKAKAAKEKNIFIISITGEQANPLAEISDINFRVEDKCPLDDLNIFPNSFFPNVLMVLEAITNEYHKVTISSQTS